MARRWRRAGGSRKKCRDYRPRGGQHGSDGLIQPPKAHVGYPPRCDPTASAGRIGKAAVRQATPFDSAHPSSGISMAARTGSGWARMARTKGPSDTTTPLAPIAMAKARYKVS